MTRTSQLSRIAGAAILTAITLAIVLSFANLRVAADRLRHLDGKWALAGLALFLVSNLLIAVRLHVVVESDRHFLRLFDLGVIHSFLASVLPARLGDVSYPLLAHRLLDIPTPAAISQILILRLYDTLTAVLLLLVAIGVIGPHTLDLRPLVAGSAAILLIVIAILLLLPAILRPAGRLLRRSIRHPIGEMTAGFAHGIADAYRATSPRQHFAILLITLVRWAFLAAVMWCAFRSVGVSIGAAGAMFITTSVNLAISLSVQTFAGLGVADAAIGIALTVLGIPVALAVSYGFSARLVRLSILFVASLGWLALRKPVFHRSGLEIPRWIR